MLKPEYRYSLMRDLGGLSLFPKRVLFCALNPSTATDTENDPTVRRMMDFARRQDASELRLVNLYAARSTDPRYLWQFDDPVGPLNDAQIDYEAARADLMVAAWGAFTRAEERERGVEVLGILQRYGTVYRLGSPTRGGHPRHPLYLRHDIQLEVHA